MSYGTKTFLFKTDVNPLPPSAAQRCRSETEKNSFEDLFSSVLLIFKKYYPSGNLKYINLGISQSKKIV